MTTLHESKIPDRIDVLLKAYGERSRSVRLDDAFDRKVLLAREINRLSLPKPASSARWRHMAIATSISLLIGLGILFREPFSGRMQSAAPVTPSPQEAISIIRESLFLVSTELRRGTSLAVEYVDPASTHSED